MLRRLFTWLLCFADDPNGGGTDVATDTGADPAASPAGGDDGAGSEVVDSDGEGELQQEDGRVREAPASKGGADDKGSGKAVAGGKQPASMLDAITKGLKEGTEAPAKPVAKAEPKPAAKTGGVDPKTGKPVAAEPKARQPLTAADLKQPDGLDPKSQARFQKIATGYGELEKSHKELEARFQQAEQHRTEFTKLMADHHVDGDAMSGFLDYNKAVKTGNFEAALRILDSQREQLAKVMGKDIPGVDALSDFPDLQKEVSEYKVTKERALEIAKQRREIAARETQDRARQQQDEQAKQSQAARDQGAKDIAAWATQMAKTDVDYPAKEAVLLDELNEIMSKYVPGQWLAELQRAYRLVRPAGGNGAARRPASEGILRPAGGSGKPEPKSMLEAITQGLTPRG